MENETLSPKEIAKRRDAAIAKMLATPPQPRTAKEKPSPGKRKAKNPRA
ncbi:MAG TPA: hypothetical protein VFS01_12180 [Rhizomicrobium sp.]|jgi:hypothetical protein|nr:hypothetical protein [Rhizomicrobium sp.]